MIVFFHVLVRWWRFYQYNEDDFRFNFDLYQAFKQHGYTKSWKQSEAVKRKSFSFIACKLVILKKLVNN